MTKNNPIESSSDPLQALGLLLVQTRTDRGVDLDELSEQLRIPKHYLLAIEQGHLEQLPEPVYVRGFIRKYSQALQIDAHPVVQRYLSLNQAQPGSTKPIVIKPLPSEKAPPSPVGRWLLYTLGVMGIVVTLSAGIRTYWPQLAVTPPIAPIDPPIPEPLPTVIARTTPPKTPVKTTEIKGQSVTLAATADAWMRVVVDDKPQFTGVLSKGASRTWQGQKNVKIRIGNAGAVLITYNQQTLGPAGKSGQVVDKVFESK